MRFALSLFFIILICYSCNSRNQSTYDKIKSLNLNSINEGIKTFYSDGYRSKAISTANLLKNSIDFFEKNFHITENFSIAIIDSAKWEKLTPIPYGLPFVSGPPFIVCIPAESNSALSKIVSTSIADYDLNLKYSMTKEDLVNLYISLIGFHELGHIYAKKYGMSFPNKWTYEFAATFFAFSYLYKKHTDIAQLWVDVSKILGKEIKPQYKSLADFEELYVKIGIKNYAWYQVIFLLKVNEVYKKEGIEFLESYKNHNWPSRSSTHFIEEMEEISPGFIHWAKQTGFTE